MKILKNNIWFTLVEIIVAITIFMIVMVSVLQIFWISVNITNKVDINRQIQENIKNLTEDISENIRKNKISWLKNEITDNYKTDSKTKWVILKTGTWVLENKYYLSLDDKNYSIIPKSDIWKCLELKNNCFLVKDDWIRATRLTNSWVAIENLQFEILWEKIKRLIITFTMRPATKKWINANLIKNSKVYFQTTLSERFIKMK